MACVPPPDVLYFGDIRVDPAYRQALLAHCRVYCAEEIVGSYLGRNPFFVSQEKWLAPSGESPHSSDYQSADDEDTQTQAGT